ncbi:MAG: hypothetical protein RQ751_06535 [Longimicrobiales bacterium]|nr:hypothetical protein [Longimicrobiales bacterium]
MLDLPLRIRHPLAWSNLRRGFPVLSAVLLGLVSACGGEGAPAGPRWQAHALEAPALDPAGMPHLSPSGDGAVLSWWAPEGDAWVLRAAAWAPEGGLGAVRDVTRGEDFFVNWADFPSVVPVAPGRWVAHWLARTGGESYAYGVRVSVSEDAGASWSDPWTPHDDGSPTEHGFVSILPEAATGEGAWSLAWLDGRRYAPGPHGEATDEMTLRARTVDAAGAPSPETVLDARVCDCCQTDAALTARGPVVAYRDRSPTEVRDVYLTRREGGVWTEGRAVHDDGWVIPGCPVNGPAVDAAGADVVVAWFTGAQDRPRVQVAFSTDAGDTFGAPVTVDQGRPVGRVDVVLRADGSALVAWLEQTDEGAEVRLRSVMPATAARPGAAPGAVPLPGPVTALARTTAARSSGFPQLAPVAGGGVLAAWTEVREGAPSRVRLALLEES